MVQFMHVRHPLSARLFVVTVVLSAALTLLGPIETAQAATCVALPGGSCSLPCAIGSTPSDITGVAAVSTNARVQGCGAGVTGCEDGCGPIHANSTSGDWVCFGGTRGLECETSVPVTPGGPGS